MTAAIRFRAARDRLIEQLRLGRTAPLRDLPVRVEPPKVPFGSTVDIRIDDSQIGVTYGLLDKDGTSVGAAVPGNGRTIVLAPPPVRVDATYVIRARKAGEVPVDLIDKATVQVAVNTRLEARIAGHSGPSPCIIDHGAMIEVEIPDSQTGVDYGLVRVPAGGPPDGADVVGAGIVPSRDGAVLRGTGRTILLPSEPLTGDAELRIRATKSSGVAEWDPPKSVILEAALSVVVRPDASLNARPADPAVARGGATAVQVEASQPGVTYQLMAADTAVGQPVAGTGHSIELPTGPIETTTSFAVRASREGVPDASVVLARTATVAVEPVP